MAELSDRERAEQRARENEEKRAATAVKERDEQAKAAAAKAEQTERDKVETESVFQYCKTQFQGFKLIPSGHEVNIERAGQIPALNLKSDGVDFVVFSITHWGEETNNFQGAIPLLAVRCRNGKFEVSRTFSGQWAVETFDKLRECLIESLSGIDRTTLSNVFLNIRMRRN